MYKIIVSPYSRPMRNGGQNPKNFPYWPELLKLLKEKEVHVTQIGRGGEKKIDGVDDMKYDLSFKDLQTLLESCDSFICVDNFFHHFTHLHNRSGVVIFSQSDPNIFGHPENINLLKDKKFLRSKQFDLWEYVDYIKDAFVTPSEVIDALFRRLNT